MLQRLPPLAGAQALTSDRNKQWPRALLAVGRPYAHAESACWAGGGTGSEGEPCQQDARSSDGAGRSPESQASLSSSSKEAFPAAKDADSLQPAGPRRGWPPTGLQAPQVWAISDLP